ncbi:MAG TPA: amidohydrolase family protein, partial [Nocardioides sp.]|nr:amidohydrolase family protein [Nocardioides sp.]
MLAAGALALPSGIVVDGWVVIDGKRVLTAGSGTPPERPSWSVAGLVVPGFVDVHVHGGGGASFDGGSPEAVARVVETHLDHGTTSVGAVCWAYYLKARDKPLKEYFYDTLALCPELHDRLKDAELVDDTVHATGNFSYASTHATGERYLMI